ncbi:MAG: DUF5666 domain-containing protein [Candidatus Doudnabacteria bacterium]
MSNKYRLLLAASLMGSLALAAPAFAQGPQGIGRVGHMGMMRGNGVFGSVTAISGNNLTVASKMRPMANTTTTSATYTVDATNATVTKNGAASTVSNIAVGDMVMVQGTVNGTSVIATKINDGIMMRKPGVFGTVATINGNTLTVTSKVWSKGNTSAATSTTYTVDDTNATVTKNGAASSVSNIAVGDTVMVQGTVNGTSITATAINDGMPPRPNKGQNPLIEGNGQPVIAGTVSAINGNTLTVANKNVTYTVDATSATVTKNNAASAVSSIAVNDSVIVQGTTNGTNVTASSITDHSASTTTSANGTTNQHLGFFGSIGNFFKHLFGF